MKMYLVPNYLSISGKTTWFYGKNNIKNSSDDAQVAQKSGEVISPSVPN